MKRAIIFLPLLSATLWASGPQQVPLNFDALEKKASNTVRVDLNMSLIKLALRWMPKDDPDTAKMAKIVSNLQGIYVRSYDFDEEGAFSSSDLDPFRKTINGTGWTCLVHAQNKKTGQNSDICLRQDGDKVLGLAILVTEPKKLTLVNIMGAIDPSDLASLEFLGVPSDLPHVDKDKVKDKMKEMKDKVKDKDKEKDKDDDLPE